MTPDLPPNYNNVVARRWELVCKQVNENLTDEEWQELVKLREIQSDKSGKHGCGIRENRKPKLIMDDVYE